MKRIFSILFFLCSLLQAIAFTPTENTAVSVMICSPGKDLYSSFGHAAIHIRDIQNHIDNVYDYGTFSYEDLPKFVTNFLTGETMYLLDCKPYTLTLFAYNLEERGIMEYPLNLSVEEKTDLYTFLSNNLLPQNRFYLYNFFYDNCSTRIRDILNEQVGGISWNEPYKATTWRSILLQYIGEKSWTSFGIHILLGKPTDDSVSQNELMFLPDFLEQSLTCATRKSNGEKLCTQSFIAVPQGEIQRNAWWDNTPLILWILAIVFGIQTFREYKTHKHCIWCDVVLFGFLGILGCVLWFISFASIHSFVFPNCNVLWLTPFHLVFACIWSIPKIRKYTQWYFAFAAAMGIFYLIVSLCVGQFIPNAVLPFIVILVLRTIRLLF